MPKRKMTIEDLAGMVKRGFDETSTKRDLESVRKDLKKDIHGLDTRMKNVEHLLLKQHSDQLRGLESRVKRLEEMYSIKFQ
jgi:hypothetical protein